MNRPDTLAHKSRARDFFVFPDPPERTPEDMTSFDHLTVTGNAYLLREYLGSFETTLVAGDHYVSLAVTGNMRGLRYPDMLVAFDVDPAAYKARNAYVVSDQGKPPDFMLEIASRSTGRIDVTDKRLDYASLGIPEYWRFDETGKYHGARLGGDRLVGGEYEPIAIEEVSESELRGYSAVLNVYLHWQEGELRFYDPATGRPLRSVVSEGARADAAEHGRAAERARADAERARADAERAARLAAEHGRAAERARADTEGAARLAADARVRELEERLRRQGAG